MPVLYEDGIYAILACTQLIARIVACKALRMIYIPHAIHLLATSRVRSKVEAFGRMGLVATSGVIVQRRKLTHAGRRTLGSMASVAWV